MVFSPPLIVLYKMRGTLTVTKQWKCNGMHLYVVLLGLLCTRLTLCEGSKLDLGDSWRRPQLHVYEQQGDINLGAVFTIHVYDEEKDCGHRLRESGVVQHVEAVVYAIEKINESNDILPGIKLGFVILDDCMKPSTALAQTLHFLPVKDRPCKTPCTAAPHSFYDVVGVIGADSSPSSIIMAKLLDIFQIPQISPSSTSDLLSNKNKYRFFMRLMPPDRLQIQAILQLLIHFNWTYVSTVYSNGGYGEEAVKDLHELARKHGICIGASIAISHHSTEADYLRIVRFLHTNGARIVVLFIDQEEARSIFRASREAQLIGEFLWIGSDGLGVNMDDLDGVEDAAFGSLTLKPYSRSVNGFEEYFGSLSPTDNPNPWIKPMWESLFDCKWQPKKWETRCNSSLHVSQSQDYSLESLVPNIVDTVYTFANALHLYIQELCQGVPSFQIKSCISGNTLLKYLYNISFEGSIGNISFDINGDILGRYEILNFQNGTGDHKYRTTSVGIWDVGSPELVLDSTQIIWNIADMSDNQSSPASPGCGQRCRRGMIYSYHKDTCCWTCRACGINQITKLNSTVCFTCSTMYWPNEAFTKCEKIHADYMGWHEPLVLVLVALSLIGITLSVVVFVIFIRRNDARIIKATSRELSYIMLGGITIQYILVFTSTTKPHTFVCVFNYIGFNVSFSVVYAALLTRTNRIFRIFYAGKRTKVMPSLTSPASQVFIALILITTQVS